MKPIDGTDAAAIEELMQLDKVLSYLANNPVVQIDKGREEAATTLDTILEQDDAVRRQLKARGGKPVAPAKTRAQIRAEVKERRRARSAYYHEKRKPRRTAKLVENVKRDGWWDVLRRTWTHASAIKPDWNIGREEWDAAVGDSIGEAIPVIHRYDTKKPWTLSNVYVLDSRTRAVLFDGAEHTMRSLGYML